MALSTQDRQKLTGLLAGGCQNGVPDVGKLLAIASQNGFGSEQKFVMDWHDRRSKVTIKKP